MVLIDIRKNINNIHTNDVITFTEGIIGEVDYNFFNDFVQVPQLPATTALRSTGLKGTYGELMTCQTDHRACWKRIQLQYDSYDAMLANFFIILQELLIQFVLSHDKYYGSRVPKIYNVYGLEDSIYIKMEYAGIELADILNQFKPSIPFSSFQMILTDILKTIDYFNRKYQFVHRDLHLGNILMKGKEIRIIDFGMACITLDLSNRQHYTLKVSSGFYDKNSPCREEQDISLMLFAFYQYFYKNGDREVKQFFDTVFDPQLFEIVQRRVPAGGELAHGSYNYNNSLFSRPEFRKSMSSEAVLSKLMSKPAIISQRFRRAPIHATRSRRLLSHIRPSRKQQTRAVKPTQRRLLSHITRKATRSRMP